MIRSRRWPLKPTGKKHGTRVTTAPCRRFEGLEESRAALGTSARSRTRAPACTDPASKVCVVVGGDGHGAPVENVFLGTSEGGAELRGALTERAA